MELRLGVLCLVAICVTGFVIIPTYRTIEILNIKEARRGRASTRVWILEGNGFGIGLHDKPT